MPVMVGKFIWILVGSVILGYLSGPPPVEKMTPEKAVVEKSIMKSGPVEPVTSITPLLKDFARKNGFPFDKRIPIGVAEIYDATGKSMSDVSSTYSKIITQAAGFFMMSALQKLNYFIVIDRTKVGFELFMREQDLRGKHRLANKITYPEINRIIGAPLVVTGAITSFQFDIKTRGGKAKVSGKGGESKYAVATVQADFVLLDTTTSESRTFSYIDTIEGRTKGVDVFSFADGNAIIDVQFGGSREDVYDLIIRRICEKAALDIAQSDMVKRYIARYMEETK